MGNERNDGEIIFRHGFDRIQEFLCFEWGQRGRRFIHDEKFSPAIKGLQDFYNLLFTFGKLPDFRFEVDAKTKFVTKFIDLARHPLQIKDFPCAWVP